MGKGGTERRENRGRGDRREETGKGGTERRENRGRGDRREEMGKGGTERRENRGRGDRREGEERSGTLLSSHTVPTMLGAEDQEHLGPSQHLSGPSQVS
ncbi:hypothetical protein NHX12_022531 [Muraenolepis orangiensis]|uniref:Uncharacterized protein n=1 Tax=Muraenolepis orangiensis TaxID=630683 RepID=A0A9Q0ENG3_9TELE|nr:hypothetical protein NHX12_022531 [Muraenolepis orangiensis]